MLKVLCAAPEYQLNLHKFDSIIELTVPLLSVFLHCFHAHRSSRSIFSRQRPCDTVGGQLRTKSWLNGTSDFGLVQRNYGIFESDMLLPNCASQANMMVLLGVE